MANLTGLPSGNHLPIVRANSEKKLGILHFAAPVDFGWRGDIRKRYTDFIVHEVRKDGTVVYLVDPKVAAEPKARNESAKKDNQNEARPKEVTPKPVEIPKVSEEDKQTLDVLLGGDISKELQDAYVAIVTGNEVSKTPINVAILHDRSRRSHIHQEVRRIFNGRFETSADPKTGAITALPAAVKNKQRGGGRNAASWRDNRGGRNGNAGNSSGNANALSKQNREGPYLHFTLYKENKDTMEAINHLARMLKIKSSNFGFAGTKDRRAATTQRVSVWRHGTDDLGWMNPKNNGIKVGDFSYHKNPIQLGQHGGNEFVIVVKNVELTRGGDCSLEHRLQMTESCVQTALNHIQEHGFINYFGLQRFGTHTIGTQEVGLKILSEDFEGAANAILFVDPALIARLNDRDLENYYHRDEINRARAIAMWKMSDDLNGALEILPKRFSAESTLLRHLGRAPESRNDYCGAVLHITRGLRNLYIHAYQSYVWNWATSLRWSKYGSKVIEGDLVLVESEANPARFRKGLDMSEDLNQDEEQFYQEARILTKEDVASGEYTIFDIVLPIPGYDVLYPENEIGEFYAEFMGRPENGGLDPYRMRRPQKEFSLSGHYRKIMARFSTVPKFFVRPYTDDAEQMHPTDFDESKALKEEEENKHEQLLPAGAPSTLAALASVPATAAAPVAPAAPVIKASAVTSDATETTSVHGITSAKTENKDAEAISEVDDDSADKTSRRRRLSPDQPEPVPETRFNEAWLANTSQGPSKRVKIATNDVVVSTTAAAKTGEDQKPPPLVLFPGQTNSLGYVSPFSGGKPPTVEEVKRLFDADGKSPSKSVAAATASGTSSKTSGNITPQSSAAAPGTPVMVTPLPKHVHNVFKAAPQDTNSENEGEPAINLTSIWRQTGPQFEDSAETKVAVALNFRLNSSNYATICLREMMSSTLFGPADASAGAGAGPAAQTTTG